MNIISYNKKFRITDRENYLSVVNDYNRTYRENRRITLIQFLGGQCKICGDKDYRHLQFDHINSDGKNEKNKHGCTLVQYYINHLDEARDKLQVLCANHNMEKKWTKAEERRILN